jgi:hypothetical protein
MHCNGPDLRSGMQLSIPSSTATLAAEVVESANICYIWHLLPQSLERLKLWAGRLPPPGCGRDTRISAAAAWPHCFVCTVLYFTVGSVVPASVGSRAILPPVMATPPVVPVAHPRLQARFIRAHCCSNSKDRLLVLPALVLPSKASSQRGLWLGVCPLSPLTFCPRTLCHRLFQPMRASNDKANSCHCQILLLRIARF